MLRATLIISLFILTGKTCLADVFFKKYSADDYIDLYKDIALREMLNHGIPASIIMGQAMVESDFGNSKLAQGSNNHFGLKCHKEWAGDTYSYDDDDAGECFRKYEHVADSYFDHSVFIKSRARYQSLFELPITDYRSWAYGLKAAGYATHPEYAKKLIDVIEKYRLYELDHNSFISTPVVNLISNSGKFSSEALLKKEPVAGKHDVVKTKGGNFIIVKPGDTYSKIAREFDLSLTDLLKYNNYSSKEDIYEGDVVFIEPKKSYKSQTYHVVSRKETINSVCKFYGISIKVFCDNNKLKPASPLPMPGTVVNVDKQPSKKYVAGKK